MQIEVATLRVAREITETENEIDRAIAAAGATLAELASVRIATGSPAAVGHRAFARLAQAQARLVEARGDVARAHEDLRQVVRADYPNGNCPPPAAIEPDRAAA